jgi:hypothetical protein
LTDAKRPAAGQAYPAEDESLVNAANGFLSTVMAGPRAGHDGGENLRHPIMARFKQTEYRPTLESRSEIRQYPITHRTSDASCMMTAGQLRASRALLGIDQRRLAELSGLSLPTIQRMEASEGVVRGNVDSLMKLVGALQTAGIELIGEGAPSPTGGRGVRLRASGSPSP